MGECNNQAVIQDLRVLCPQHTARPIPSLQNHLCPVHDYDAFKAEIHLLSDPQPRAHSCYAY